MRLGRWAVLAIGIAAAACASTIGPIVPSIQVLVVLDSLDDTLRIIPVDTPSVVHKVALNVNIGVFGEHALALNGGIAAIGLGRFAILYNLAPTRVMCIATMDGTTTASIASLAFADNGFVYAAIPGAPLTNNVPHFDPSSSVCGVGEGSVRGSPRAFANARGTLFVVTGGAPSWLATTTTESADNTPLSLVDSILLSPPGNAQGAVLGSDGFLYVINAGSGQPQTARLSEVNPVSRTELSSIGGFGTLPQYIATDGADQIFVASAVEGLMVYNLRTNHVDRDANSAIPLVGAPRGLVVDDLSRVYALIAGSCGQGLLAQGQIRVFGADLVNRPSVPVGTCPVAIGVTNLPATLYHFNP
jgi:hypothetical protein